MKYLAIVVIGALDIPINLAEEVKPDVHKDLSEKHQDSPRKGHAVKGVPDSVLPELAKVQNCCTRLIYCSSYMATAVDLQTS